MNPGMRFALVDLIAKERLPAPRAAFYGVLAVALGGSPVGLGMTLVLANREAEQQPVPTSTQTAPETTAPVLQPPAAPHEAGHKAKHSS
jgi:hypothetical protein